MSQITIKRRGWWGSIPENLLTDYRLGHAAVRLGAWLAIRPDGWVVRKNNAKDRLQLGEASWDRACKELKAAGYMVTCQTRRSGTFAGVQYAFDPEGKVNESSETVLPPTVRASGGDTGPGEPAHLTGSGLEVTRVNESIKTTTTTTEAGCGQNLVWPPVVLVELIPAAAKALDGLNAVQQQELLDELSAQPMGKVKNPVGWLRTMSKMAKRGNFTAELAPEVRVAREARARHEQRLRATAVVKKDASSCLDKAAMQELAAAARLRLKAMQMENRRGA